ncbi:UNVERIFIED_CONTAM: mazG [Trichonephila clavipes]
MQELRQKCPWDQQQTPSSLTRYAIEEAYEVEAAIRVGDLDEIRNELGDLLLQVVFQSQMYSEQGAFNFQDVVDAISEKLIRRHPHVFQAEQFENLNSEQVSELWKQIKQQEKQGKAQSRLDEVKHAPALVQAQEIQKKAAQLGFDFETLEDAYGKLDEELGELQHAIKAQKADEIEEEFGDCLFSLINVGRKLGLSSETALLATIHKFRSRFAFIEQQAQRQHKDLQEMMYAQQFDQSYEKWKAQQQARDQQLAKQPNNNYYLSRPSQQQTNKQLSSSVSISGDKISLNQANLAQLQSLSGVGAKKAQAIMEYRQKNGGFKKIDELVNVKGIGPKLLEKNKARLIL